MSDIQHELRYYDAEQAARKLGCSVQGIERLVHSGDLRSVVVGDKTVIPAHDLDDLSKRGSLSAPKPKAVPRTATTNTRSTCPGTKGIYA